MVTHPRLHVASDHIGHRLQQGPEVGARVKAKQIPEDARDRAPKNVSALLLDKLSRHRDLALKTINHFAEELEVASIISFQGIVDP